MTITSHIFNVYGPYFKSKHHRWEFSPQLHGCPASRAKALSSTFGSTLASPLFNQISLLLHSSYSPSCICQFPGPFVQSFSELFCTSGLYYHLVFQSLCLPASLPSITLSDRIQIAVPVSTSPNHLKVILKHSSILSIATFIYYSQNPLRIVHTGSRQHLMLRHHKKL